MDTRLEPIIVQPGAGKNLFAYGNVLSVMLAGEQTGEALSVMLEQTPPGGGPPLHAHAKEDEIFLVVEGQLSYYVGGRWIEVSSGGVVYLPRGTAHCYRNTGATPGLHWIITTPSGFEQFFARSAEEFEKTGQPEQSLIAAIHQEYGIELL